MSLLNIFIKIKEIFTTKDNHSRIEPNYSLANSSKFKNQNLNKPLPIDISKAKAIYLPQLPFTKDSSNEEFDRNEYMVYWNHFNSGLSYYKSKSYQKAKGSFLKIIEMQHRSSAYYTHLLRTYRKLVDKFISEQKYDKAKDELLEMFSKCPNTTNTDITKFNKLLDIIGSMETGHILEKKELNINIEPDFAIESDHITFISECKKPRNLKLPPANTISIYNLIRHSDLIPASLPHLSFYNNILEYNILGTVPDIEHGIYRFRESSKRNAFIMSSQDLNIYLYDPNLNLLHSFDASRFSQHHYHLRRVELASNLGYFMFTNIDKAYLLDSNFTLIASWEVPHKEGWHKVKGDTVESLTDIKEKEYQNLLCLSESFTKDEIKSSFRTLAFQYHPDRNPGNPHANDKMKEIIEAYEYLTKEEAKSAFKGMRDAEYWEKVISTHKIEVAGVSLTITLSMGGPGEDWIYGSGISDDGSRIYLGCYSGKTYQIKRDGIAEKVYIIPEDKEGIYGQSNPVTYVLEQNGFLYILSYWYLYVFNDDKLVKYIKLDKAEVKWFDSGFLFKFNNEVKLYKADGDFLGHLSTKERINNLCFKDDVLLVETNSKALSFYVHFDN